MLEAARDLERPELRLPRPQRATAVGLRVQPHAELADGRVAAAGERVRLAGEIENRLMPGRYFVDCYIARDGSEHGDIALQGCGCCDFVVYGHARRRPGSCPVERRPRGRAAAGP